jgi:acetyltransferase-like isoleucine patch superfamily enzyme
MRRKKGPVMVADRAVNGVLALVLRMVRLCGFKSFDLARRQARRLGVHVGPETVLYGGVSFGSEPWLVHIGRGTWVTHGVRFITHDGSIQVVRNGPFGIPPGTSLNRYDAVVVGENCFIGVQAILLPGTTIGDHSIVGAGSVVSGTVPSRTIVAGNPARVVGKVADFADRVRTETIDFPRSWPDEPTMRRVMAEKVWARRTR